MRRTLAGKETLLGIALYMRGFAGIFQSWGIALSARRKAKLNMPIFQGSTDET